MIINIIYLSIIILIFVLFWQTIYTLVTSQINNIVKDNKNIIGNIWFICLVIINISIISFIYIFNYYKLEEKGPQGFDGEKGFDGIIGEPCSIKSENCNN